MEIKILKDEGSKSISFALTMCFYFYEEEAMGMVIGGGDGCVE